MKNKIFFEKTCNYLTINIFKDQEFIKNSNLLLVIFLRKY